MVSEYLCGSAAIECEMHSAMKRTSEDRKKREICPSNIAIPKKIMENRGYKKSDFGWLSRDLKNEYRNIKSEAKK